MGKKPLVGLAGLCLAGLIVCGCQDNKQSASTRRTGLGGNATRVPGPTPAPGGSPTASSGWDTTPARNMAGSPTATADLAGRTGSTGLGSSAPLGSSGSGLGSSTLASGMRSPATSAPAVPGGGLSDASGLGGSSTGSSWGPKPASTALPQGMDAGTLRASQGGSMPGGMPGPRVSDPPPASAGGMSSSAGLGGSPPAGMSSASTLVSPPPPPPGMGAAPQGTFNLGGDPGAASPSASMNQSKMTGSYRTVPPGLGGSSAPPVPTMTGSTTEP